MAKRGYLRFYLFALALSHSDLYADEPNQDTYDLFRVYVELERILASREKLQCLTPPEHFYSGDITFQSSTGWKFVIFDDCGEWDYIENIITPEGESLNAQFGWSFIEELGSLYNPTEADLEEIWGWPKYRRKDVG